MKARRVRQKTKPDTNSIANNGVVQHEDKKVASGVDFYNKFERKEGQPVLTAEQYNIIHNGKSTKSMD